MSGGRCASASFIGGDMADAPGTPTFERRGPLRKRELLPKSHNRGRGLSRRHSVGLREDCTRILERVHNLRLYGYRRRLDPANRSLLGSV